MIIGPDMQYAGSVPTMPLLVAHVALSSFHLVPSV